MTKYYNYVNWNPGRVRSGLLKKSKSKSKSRSRRNNGSFLGNESDKSKLNALRSKSVYKEEKLEFNKKVNGIFQRYRINDVDVNRQMKLVQDKDYMKDSESSDYNFGD